MQPLESPQGPSRGAGLWREFKVSGDHEHIEIAVVLPGERNPRTVGRELGKRV
jgi:hypothetical protein